MCCAGCQAVARAIVDAGMTDYYRYRTDKAQTGKELVPEFLRQIQAYDLPAVQKRFIKNTNVAKTSDNNDTVDANNARREVALILEGITCAACIWLNEKYLMSLPGVLHVDINYSNHRATVSWDESKISLSQIIEAISRIGYLAHPYDPDRRQQLEEKQRKSLLGRIGVAGVLGMQVMTLAVALYTGDWWGMEEGFREFFRWASLLLTLPVLLFSANVFFINAWNGMRNKIMVMDIPVSLGIGVAAISSIWSTITGVGEIYFDAVVMFTMFLLIARYFELSARRRTSESTDRMAQLLPAAATRLQTAQGQPGMEEVAVAELEPDDLVLVQPGASIPADGVIEQGQTSVDESLLTGESMPVSKQVGDTVIGGSINLRSPLEIRVSSVGEGSVLSTILDMLDRASHDKPAISRLADQIAGWFVAGILLVAASVSAYWLWQGDPGWIAITISVLVVTCPCALSLATPAAMSAATGRLAQLGVIVVRGHSVETLIKTEHFVFDKTGTLTDGKMQLLATETFTAKDATDCLDIAAALEHGSEHPLGQAIRHAADGEVMPTAQEIRNHPGSGVSGKLQGVSWWIGNAAFIQAQLAHQIPPCEPARAAVSSSHILLADKDAVVARFYFADNIRPGARLLIQYLQSNGRKLSLLSGDQQAVVAALAQRLEIDDFHAQMLPADKLAAISKMQSQGEIVAMLGDGVNDAPVLAQAQLSIAMGSGTRLASVNADMVLLSDRLEHLIDALQISQKTMRIVKQNMTWALAYNILALPAAAAGLIPPWLAALGMSASSLVVVGNSLRIIQK